MTKALGLVVLLALLAPEALSEQTHTVVIESMKYREGVLRARVGDRITWINNDLVPHTATSAAPAFDSGSIDPGKSWTWVAQKAGRFPYFCTFHPPMKGELIVE
ncbi:MAG TPA: cupredoxin family copper-binding protein [Steroidobacteraceae bacterium]